MATEIFSDDVNNTIQEFQTKAKDPTSKKTVLVDGQSKEIPYPFPSPGDWRDCWIYFLMIDRFNDPTKPPKSPWNQKYGFRQGGTLKGVQQQLPYIQSLGARAIWLSPVLKNSKPPKWEYNYHGYATQDFLNVDERFASDGTRATAERELIELIDEAHARGLYVIMDIVINHSARVFDYVYNGQIKPEFQDGNVINAPLGQEPSIQWLNGYGYPRADWQDDFPPGATADDAVWPKDLQRKVFFRRRGSKLNDKPDFRGFVPGDFGSMRQLVVEYDAQSPDQEPLRDQYGRNPVLSILIRTYQYLIAKYDLDGLRIDTVKYVAPSAVQTFGNSMREFALSCGKRNFFTFGEIYDDEETVAKFVGRNSSDIEGFGIDAALDFPLFYELPKVAKGSIGVETIRRVFERRKRAQESRISSHGEAGSFFVSFLDNHDQNERFKHPNTPQEQVTLGLAALFCLQGIPCLYYGTEQGLQGTVDSSGKPTLDSNESTREALWGKTPTAFDSNHPLYIHIQKLAKVRQDEPALRYGRLYFREVSGNGQGFGHSQGQGGIIAFSRILVDREILVVANTKYSEVFKGFILVDRGLNATPRQMTVAYSNLGKQGTGKVQIIEQARFYEAGNLVGTGKAAALYVELAPIEIQILVPN